MLLQAAQDLNIDLTKSYLVGDRFNDMEAGKKIGVRGILVKTGFGQGLLQDDGPDNKADGLGAVKGYIKSHPLTLC